MSATYSTSGIVASGTDYISATRFLIQDTDVTVAEVQDEEITAIYTSTIELYGSATGVQEQRVYYTALQLAKALHRRYAKQATFSSGGTSVQLKERAEYWLNVVDDLAMKLATLTYNGSLFAVVGRNPPYYENGSNGYGVSESYIIDRW
jgi:hypothetical protein